MKGKCYAFACYKKRNKVRNNIGVVDAFSSQNGRKPWKELFKREANNKQVPLIFLYVKVLTER